MGKTLNFKELDVINRDIKKFSDNVITQMTESAKLDMVKAHDQIIDKFYGSHTPTSYKRHGIGGLYKSIYGEKIYNKLDSNYGWATVKVSSQDMDEHYRTSAANVLDLMWIHGVRGLPREGNQPLTHDFDWRYPGITYHWTAGQKWHNPYWSGEMPKYHNVFRTQINMYGYTTPKKMVPNMAMIDFINHWGHFRGINIADKIWKEF